MKGALAPEVSTLQLRHRLGSAGNLRTNESAAPSAGFPRAHRICARWGGGRGDTSAQLRRPLAAPFKTPSRNPSASSPAPPFPPLPPCAPEKLLSVYERPRI